MVTPPESDALVRRRLLVRTADFDEAHETMQRVFLPMAMWPMSPPQTELDMQLESNRVDQLMLSIVRFGWDIGLRSVDADSYHVAAPVTGVAESRVRGDEPIENTRQRATIFPVDEPIDIRWRGDCAQMCLDFPRAAVRLRLEQHLDRPLRRPLVFDPAMDLTTPKGRSWRRMLHMAIREARREHGLLDHPLAAKSVESALVDGLLLAQTHNYSDALLHDTRVAPPRAVREAIELLVTYPDRAWTAPMLAGLVHVSVRALQEGFRRSLDTTPMRYLREVRLRKVREDLSAATPEITTVSQIVHRWGILNHGRFAATYREKFGESPSETLRDRQFAADAGGRQ